MSRRGSKKKRKDRSQRKQRHEVSRLKIAKIRKWLDRMRENSQRAIALTEGLSFEDLHESNHLFWALVKYAENVEESIKELDKISGAIFPELIEVDEATWTGLKKMRERLAHQFWNVDPEVLWNTATIDFVILHSLLKQLVIHAMPMGRDDKLSLVVSTEDLLSLPSAQGKDRIEAGRFLVLLCLANDGRVRAFRVGHRGNQLVLPEPNFDMQFAVYGRRRRAEAVE